MTLIHALLLGIIQGLTEFIPVSSTAHLLIGQRLLGLPADDAMFSFLVLVQIGTIVSLFFYFWKDLVAILVDTLKNLNGFRNFKSLPENAKIGWYIIIATIPALVAGYLLKDAVEALFRLPLLEAAIRLFSAAILLSLAERLTRKDRQLNTMTWLDALVVGCPSRWLVPDHCCLSRCIAFGLDHLRRHVPRLRPPVCGAFCLPDVCAGHVGSGRLRDAGRRPHAGFDKFPASLGGRFYSGGNCRLVGGALVAALPGQSFAVCIFRLLRGRWHGCPDLALCGVAHGHEVIAQEIGSDGVPVFG